MIDYLLMKGVIKLSKTVEIASLESRILELLENNKSTAFAVNDVAKELKANNHRIRYIISNMRYEYESRIKYFESPIRIQWKPQNLS